ncbi:MAG: UvrB/UvrC motif-containing protein [Verrucomicrobiae bacterium]|nr:UvrB/UvrC motif-containing protein [Verrucomicrobiae bacterium]
MTNEYDKLLKEWPYEPGVVQAREATGSDGEPRIQLRVDLGILQMELAGRPDGLRPMGCESLLEHFERLAARAEREGKPEAFRLTPEDCVRLQQEGVQYYHRYLACFQLQRFAEVARDTERNLRLFDFVEKHANKGELGMMFQQFRPYVLMMRSRARAMLALQKEEYDEAIRLIEEGLGEIRSFLEDRAPSEVVENCSEIGFLQKWLDEIKRERPLTPREKLQRQLHEAVETEDYEKAARLRDALKELE